MAKTLGWIAVGGLSVGFVSLALAYVLGGRNLDALLDRSIFLAKSCGDSSGKADAKLDCQRWGGLRDIEITLPGRAFRRIGLSGSTKLTMENVNQPDLAFKISGSGTVRAQGTVDHATVNVAGSGDVHLADLAMKELTAKISGSGKIEAAPKHAADIHISGSGDVRLLSHPTRLISHVASSGRITQTSLDPDGGKDKR